jgi:4-hydroxybenzoate polyprenyltransferase
VWLTAVSLCLLIPAAAHFGTFSLALVCFGTAGGLAYDLVLKQTRWSLLGYLVGFLSLLTWIWQVAGHLTLRLVLIYPLAAFLIVAAHLAQTYPDIESDQLAGHRNLAVALGVEITSILVCGFTTVLSMAALMAAIVARLGFAGALGGAAFILAAIIWLMRPASLERRDVRVTMFHLAAPAAALAAASLVLTLRDIAF